MSHHVLIPLYITGTLALVMGLQFYIIFDLTFIQDSLRWIKRKFTEFLETTQEEKELISYRKLRSETLISNGYLKENFLINGAKLIYFNMFGRIPEDIRCNKKKIICITYIEEICN